MNLSNRITLFLSLLLCLNSFAHGQQNENSTDTAMGLGQFMVFQPGELLSFPPVTEVNSPEVCKMEDSNCGDAKFCLPLDEDEGLCATVPVGGVAYPTSASSFPAPIAHFPLAGGSLGPWPVTGYSGVSHEIEWKKDPRFGYVPHCEEDSSSMIALRGVEFGNDGPFSINLWIKKDKETNLEGGAFQYIFSVTSLANANLARGKWEFANQVHIFIPETLGSAPPVVRVIVQDSDDGGNISYMDSDGVIQRVSAPSANSTSHADLGDGNWHMITVTTMPEEAKGFRIFVDGELTAEAPADGEQNHGGRPIFADGDIFLCGRTDHNPDRHFDGSVTQLSIYNVRLTAEEVHDLYRTVGSDGHIGSDNLSFARNKENEEEVMDTFKSILHNVSLPGFSDLNEFRHEEYSAIATRCTETDDCQEGELCGALHANTLAQFNMANATDDEEIGMCATPPVGGMPDNKALEPTPVPAAFFPLTGGDTRSWPVPKYSGLPLRVDLHQDEVFESVFRCSQRNLSIIVMDEVPIGENGAFALNIWFRPTNLAGRLFQYMISQTDRRNSGGTAWGEQLNVYLGETHHVAFGLVRTIYKDEDDTLDEVYLDSDGFIGLTEPNERIPTVEVKDGNWHMYTFTTNAPGEKGYRVYIDGILVGEINEANMKGFEDLTPGGAPFTPVGALLLCGRKDGHPQRHYEGDLAHLSLFDTELSEEAIEGLYASISEEKLAVSRDLNVPPEYPSVPFIFNPFSGILDAPEAESESAQEMLEAPGDPHATTHPPGPPPIFPPIIPAPPPPGVYPAVPVGPQVPAPDIPGVQTPASQTPPIGVGMQVPFVQPALGTPGTAPPRLPISQPEPAPIESMPVAPETSEPSVPTGPNTPALSQPLSPETPPPEVPPSTLQQPPGTPVSTVMTGATEQGDETIPVAPVPGTAPPRGPNFVSDLD